MLNIKHLTLLFIFMALLSCTQNELLASPTKLHAPEYATESLSQLWGVRGELWDPKGRLPDFSYAGYQRGEKAIPSYPITANVKDFGAIGDGKTDDTHAFQAAIAATSSGAVWVPEGTYRITDYLYIRKSGIVLRGAGPEKTILYFPKSLSEITARTSETSSGQPTTAYSFDYAFITIEGKLGKRLLANPIAGALRGDKTIRIHDTRAFKTGQEIVIRVHEDQAQTLKTFLYANDSADISKGKPLDTQMVARITQVGPHDIIIDRHLRFDLRQEWRPEIVAFEPTTVESGVENLGMSFPDLPYLGHFNERGFNAIEFRSVAHSWAKNIHIHNADMGVLFKDAMFTTADAIQMTSFSGRGAMQGHHAFQAKDSQDNLIINFNLHVKFVHDLSVEDASGNVFADGKGLDLSFDHHKDTPYENLYTNIDSGLGDSLWKSGGGGGFGKHSAAWATFWNIHSRQSIQAPTPAFSPALVNFVGVTFSDASKTELNGVWREYYAGKTIYPHNIWRAQLEKRLKQRKL